MNRSITVIGSINMDLVVKTDRVPEAGETIAGQTFNTIPGGKGANQAVAIARLGGEVSMVGCLGADAFGAALFDHLKNQGVSMQCIRKIEGQSTGTATIMVEKSGDNRIIIVAGANGDVSPSDVDRAAETISRSKAVVMQFEIPMPTVEYAAALAKSQGIPVVLNPAPAYPVSPELFSHVDYLILNETEAKTLSGTAVDSLDSAFAAAARLRAKGAGCVIVTLGDRGAVALSQDQKLYEPAGKVKVVDTTAAGDAFVGSFALAISSSMPLETSLKRAIAAGSLAVTRFGAQPSLPAAEELESYLGGK